MPPRAEPAPAGSRTEGLRTTITAATSSRVEITYSLTFLKVVTPVPSTRQTGKMSQAKIDRMAIAVSDPTARKAASDGTVRRARMRQAKTSVTIACNPRAAIHSFVA